MTPSLVADVIINLCGACGVCVGVWQALRNDPHNPATRALNALLAVLGGLFATRGAAWLTNIALFDDAALFFAIALAPAALLATEHLLRRHAPRALKIGALAGGAALVAAWVFGLDRAFMQAYYAALAGYQLLAIMACGLLLARRDRAGLSPAENRQIDRLGLATLIAAPLLLTDFRAIFADMPVRAGPLGVLAALGALQAAERSGARVQYGVVLSIRLVAGAGLGIGCAAMAGRDDAASLIRFAAVCAAGVLTIAMLAESARLWLLERKPGALAALAATRFETREAMIAALRRSPDMGDFAHLTAADFADYDPDALGSALQPGALLRAGDGDDPLMRERIATLLAARQATHLAIVATEPLEALAFAAPAIAAEPGADAALRLMARILAALPANAEA